MYINESLRGPSATVMIISYEGRPLQ